MAQRNETPILILALLLTLAILWFARNRFFPPNSPPETPINPPISSSPTLSPVLSLGQTLLFPQDTTPQKLAGIQAFSAGNYQQAGTYWQDSLQIKLNDPETRIYLNNAQAKLHNPLTIAVSIPISKNENIAKEILRGVAQAQQEINQKGGINGRYLQVAIINDNNDPNLSAQVAQTLVKDKDILAVIGHNSSDATLGAAPAYQKGGLVMISPTSNANQIATIGNYIFRTIPSVRFEANALSRYIINQVGQKNLGICFDSQAKYSIPFKEDFTSAFFSDGGQVLEINCDLADPNFNALTIVNEAKKKGVQGILLIPSVDRLPAAVALAQANQKQLSLYGSSSLYTFATLQEGRSVVEGMILPVPWHPQALKPIPFPQNAVKLWGGDVNWRSALAYDATQALIRALSENPTRQGVQQSLAHPDFSSEGATGTIRFLPSGDRNQAPFMVQIRAQPQSKSNTGFDFIYLP